MISRGYGPFLGWYSKLDASNFINLNSLSKIEKLGFLPGRLLLKPIILDFC